MDFFGIVLLLAIVGGAVWYFKFRKTNNGPTQDAPASGGDAGAETGDAGTDAEVKDE